MVNYKTIEDGMLARNPLSPGRLSTWHALGSYTKSTWLAFNSVRVMEECEKNLLSKCKVIFLNYKSCDKAL